MKSIITFFTYLSLAALMVTGCDKTEDTINPFEGADNHITSFILKKDDARYVAAVTADTITVTVPVNVSLTGFTAEYQLCENATINPDPATITDWNNEQQFAVTAYNGTKTTYKYTVEHSDVVRSGAVVLTTQAEVDAFGQGGCTVIDGYLIIGSTGKPDAETAIVNLNGLSSIKEVKYHIIINSSFAGTTLDGLNNVEKCGGFYIGAATAKMALPGKISVALPALTTAGDIILSSDSIQSVSFAHLQSVSNFQLSSKTVDNASLPLLKEVIGNFSLTNASNMTNTALTSISLPQLTTIGGSIVMQYFSGLVGAEFPQLNYVGGGIDVTLNSNTLEELGFPELVTANGIINIERAPGLLELSFPKMKNITSFIYNKTSYANYPLASLDFSSLETIADEFYIRGIPLESVSFPKLKSAGGNITVWDLKSMIEFKVPEIKEVGGKLYFYSANQLGSLDLSKLTVLGALELVGCLQLNTVESPSKISSITINYASNANCPTPVFNGLESVAGQLSLASAAQVDNFNIAQIKHIGTFTFSDAKAGATLTLQDVETIGTMNISTYKLTTLHAPKLTEVKNLTWTNVWSLATIDLPALRTVTNFTLSEHGSYNAGNARMTNLNAFSGITSISKVTISYCAKLVDFSGLSNALSGLTAENWSVTNCGYNPTHKQMIDGAYSNE